MNNFEPQETHYSEDELADILDTLIPPDTHEAIQTDDELDPVLAMAVRLASVPNVAPSSLMLARVQAQMLATNKAQHPPAPRVMNIIALFARTAAAAVTVLFVMSALSALMDYAVPGDLLYPAKRAFESGQIVFAEGAYDVAETRLIHARERISEAEQLLARGKVDLDLIEQINQDIQAARLLAFNEEIGAQLDSVESTLYRLIARANASNDTTVQSAFAYNNFYSILTVNTGTQSTVSRKPARNEITFDDASLLFYAPQEIAITGDATLANVILEVQVNAVEGNMLSLANTDLFLSADDPLLDVVRKGDFIRLDGQISITSEGEQRLVNVNEFVLMDALGELITLEMNANRLEAWRDSGTCENPPPPWAMATAWRIRCRNVSASNTSS